MTTGLPAAVRVLDAFHVVQLGFAAVDDVRRRVQQQTHGHRGRVDDPLYRIRSVLHRGAEHLTATAWARLLAGIEAGDERGQIAARRYDWTVLCIDSGVPELARLARTITT